MSVSCRFYDGSKGRVSFTRGKTTSHYGHDIVGRNDKTIFAPYKSVIIRAETGADGYVTYGKWVYGQMLEGPYSGYYWVVAHLSEYWVKVGDIVATGQSIGTKGNTGHSDGSHAHVELHSKTWPNATRINPDPLSGFANNTAGGTYSDNSYRPDGSGTGNPGGGTGTPTYPPETITNVSESNMRIMEVPNDSRVYSDRYSNANTVRTNAVGNFALYETGITSAGPYNENLNCVPAFGNVYYMPANMPNNIEKSMGIKTFLASCSDNGTLSSKEDEANDREGTAAYQEGTATIKEEERDTYKRAADTATAQRKQKQDELYALETPVNALVTRANSALNTAIAELDSARTAATAGTNNLFNAAKLAITQKLSKVEAYCKQSFITLWRRVTAVRCPANGLLGTLQQVVQWMFELHRTAPLTAAEYDALNLTAAQYANYGLTAMQYDVQAKIYLV